MAFVSFDAGLAAFTAVLLAGGTIAILRFAFERGERVDAEAVPA